MPISPVRKPMDGSAFRPVMTAEVIPVAIRNDRHFSFTGWIVFDRLLIFFRDSSDCTEFFQFVCMRQRKQGSILLHAEELTNRQ